MPWYLHNMKQGPEMHCYLFHQQAYNIIFSTMERTNNLIPLSPLEIYFEEEWCHCLTLTLSACNPLQTKASNRNKRLLIRNWKPQHFCAPLPTYTAFLFCCLTLSKPCAFNKQDGTNKLYRILKFRDNRISALLPNTWEAWKRQALLSAFSLVIIRHHFWCTDAFYI